MQKIPTLFMKNRPGDGLVRNEITPGAEWVEYHGIASPMYDGIAYKISHGGTIIQKRYILVPGEESLPGFVPTGPVDPITGKQPGWDTVWPGRDRMHLGIPFTEAFSAELKWTGNRFAETDKWANGTYELCGPRINGNPEGYEVHMLVPHGYGMLLAFPRTFDEIKAAFMSKEWSHQGVVWRHEDGRMVKIKVSDFGLQRHCRGK